ncbi:MAG: PAS domain-containing protein, partial [Gammaproteobacteria bacterium]|nr:PAS domain-containing protein [Gammaproteobacteria bacterium]
MEGRFENDVLAMVDESLKIPLTTALHRAAKTHEQVTTRRLSLEHSGKKKIYDLIVKFIGNHGADSSHFFITLKPVSKQAVSKEHPAEPENLIELDDIPAHLQQRITDLEQELQTSKETLQETIEELQSTNQELQTSNEELMASNEELQSTNEELHSVNEELYTVNAEFEDKNNELKELNQDHVNLLNSLEVGIVFVDKQMRIRKFNPAIERIFNLLPQDIGRPIDHIAYHIDNQKKMLQDFRHVLETGEHREMDVRTEDGQWLLKRILPFRAQDKIEGVLLTFTDINMLKEAEDALRQHAEELEQKVKKRTRSLEIAKEVADAANRAKSAFLANMSHEIRTPMSGVLMATELLAEMDPSPRQADLISTLQKGALNLNTILDDILDFSKIEAGKIDMVKEPLFVKEVVKDIIGFYQPRVTAKNLSVAIEIDPGIPKMLMG